MSRLTKHARRRMQQRGKSYNQVQFILDNGKLQKAPGHATLFVLTRSEVSTRITNLKRKIQLLERYKDTGVLVDNETQLVITVMNIY